MRPPNAAKAATAETVRDPRFLKILLGGRCSRVSLTSPKTQPPSRHVKRAFAREIASLVGPRLASQAWQRFVVTEACR